MITSDVVERFWSKVQKGDGCWLWTAKKVGGYGAIHVRVGNKNTMQYAHRIMWQMLFGEIPDGMCVLHTCDNPQCVNPIHLRLGTHQENMADRNQKRRQKRGGNDSKSRLTDGDALDIKRLANHLSQKEIALKYKISDRTVSSIVTGRTWKHLDEKQAPR